MANARYHEEVSREYFGNESLGIEFHKLMDENHKNLGRYHRRYDHDFDRLLSIGEKYGLQGYKEILLHLCLDYGLYKGKRKLMQAIIERKTIGISIDISEEERNEYLEGFIRGDESLILVVGEEAEHLQKLKPGERVEYFKNQKKLPKDNSQG